MKSKLFLASLLLILTFSTSCVTDDDNINFTYDIAYVNEVNAPSSTTVGNAALVEVKFLVVNGCGGFERFIESTNGNTIDIEIEAKYAVANCTQATQIVTVNYLFEPTTTGRYTLNFRSSPTEFISVSINVN